MGIPERLKQIVSAYGSDLKAFSRHVDVPYRTLQNYLLGKRARPRHDILERICTRSGTDLRWLLTGEGTMREPDRQPDVLPDVASWLPPDLAGQEKRVTALLALLAEIPVEARDAILDECFARATTAQQLDELRQAVSAMGREQKKKTG